MTHMQQRKTNIQTQSRSYQGIFIPKKNIQYQVYIYIDSYHTRLSILAKNSEIAKNSNNAKLGIIQAAQKSTEGARPDPT